MFIQHNKKIKILLLILLMTIAAKSHAADENPLFASGRWIKVETFMTGIYESFFKYTFYPVRVILKK